MKKRIDGDYIEDIYNSIQAIERYVKGYTLEDFEKDDKTHNAVIRMLEVIGEAGNKISDRIKEKYPQAKWDKIRGMRNRIAHEYFGLDLNIVWDVIGEDLLSLKAVVKKILSELDEE